MTVRRMRLQGQNPRQGTSHTGESLRVMTIPSKAIPEVSPSVNPLRRKKTYCCAGAAFLAAVSFVAAVNMNPYRLPDPEHADREGLFRWLVTRDLSQEGADLRRLLVARLERE